MMAQTTPPAAANSPALRVAKAASSSLVGTGARIAAGLVVVAGSVGGSWWGIKQWPAKTDGPTKQVATGAAGESKVDAAAVAAIAALSDGDLVRQPSAFAAPHPANAAANEMAAPPTSSFVPPPNDLPGRYGGQQKGSLYSAYSEAAAAAPVQPAADPTAAAAAVPPADPLQPATSPAMPATTPAAETSVAAGGQFAPPTSASSFAASSEVPATNETNGPAPTATEPTVTATDVAGAYANRFGGGQAASGGQLAGPPATSPAEPLSPTMTAPPAPPNRLPSGLAGSVSLAPTTELQPIVVGGSVAGTSPARLSGASSPADVQVAAAAAVMAQGAKRLAAATPGERQMEGLQQPVIALEKVSPSEIQVGKAALFELYVRNTGQVPAQNVVVTDHVPAGTQLQAARPQPQQAADGGLMWSLGTMQPGEEKQIALEVIPQSEGEIGSTAQVSFAAAATSRSICTRPQLTIEHTAPPKVLIGDMLTVGITIANPGSGPATGVTIEEDVPDGLAHVAGPQLEYEVGTLRPGESKRLELSLRAQKAGIVQNTINVRGDANLAAQHTVQIEVVAPQLAVDVEGPKRKFLERQATYTVQVANPGTATAHDVQLVAALPRGMKFVAADSQGQYDAAQHAVFWSLAELPPSKAGPVKLTTLPIEPGEQRLQVKAQAEMGLTAAGEQIVQVEQAAELLHTVKDADEVIEVGSETSYEIRVTNSGTKAATNVRVAALLPAGLAAIGGDGPTRVTGDAAQVAFEPLPRLNPQEEVIYRIQVQGKQPGDQIVRVQLSSDERATPVTREESTHVYLER